MKLIYTLVAIAAIATSACTKDPVVDELQAFNKLGSAAFRDLNTNGLNQKMALAKTNEEKAALMDEIIQTFEARSKEMTAFQAKTPEVGKISATFNKGIDQALAGAKQAKASLLAGDQSGLSAAATELSNGQKLLRESGVALVALAKEKQIKLTP